MILSFLEEYNSNGGSQATCLKNTAKVAIKPSARLVNIVLSVNMQPCALFVSCTTSFIGLPLIFFINTVVSVNINTNALFVSCTTSFVVLLLLFFANLPLLSTAGPTDRVNSMTTVSWWHLSLEHFCCFWVLKKRHRFVAYISNISNVMIPVMVIMTTSNIRCDDSEDRGNKTQGKLCRSL